MLEPEVILGIIENKIKKNVVFGDLLSQQSKTSLINKSLIRTAEAGQILCQQSHHNNTLFLIIEGEVEISSESNGNKNSLGKLGEGELVGEISALFKIPRIATATVTQPSVVLEIPGEVFSAVLSDNPEVKNTFIKRCKNLVIETTLRCAPVFNDLDKQSFSELCYLSSIVTAKKDQVIAHEGKMEKSLYVIGSGTARAYITIDGKEITIALLRAGDYFGEYSLFTGDSRCASVSSLSDMQLVLLEGEAFQSFIEFNEETEEQISMQILDRKKSLDHIRDNLIVREAAESRLNQVQNRLGI